MHPHGGQPNKQIGAPTRRRAGRQLTDKSDAKALWRWRARGHNVRMALLRLESLCFTALVAAASACSTPTFVVDDGDAGTSGSSGASGTAGAAGTSGAAGSGGIEGSGGSGGGSSGSAGSGGASDECGQGNTCAPSAPTGWTGPVSVATSCNPTDDSLAVSSAAPTSTCGCSLHSGVVPPRHFGAPNDEVQRQLLWFELRIQRLHRSREQVSQRDGSADRGIQLHTENELQRTMEQDPRAVQPAKRRLVSQQWRQLPASGQLLRVPSG